MPDFRYTLIHMNRKAIKAGMIGTNFVSDMFMKGTENVEDLEVTAVASGHHENAERFAKKYGIENVYDNLDEMLTDKKVDFIYLAVPNSLHYEMSRKCLEQHMPVMTEKPFVPAVKQAEELFELSERNHTYIHDALVPLYTKHFQEVKNAVSEIGQVRHVAFHFSKYSSRYDAYLAGKNPTTFQKELCNGAWMDLGIYCIGDLVALFGKPQKILSHSILLDTGVDVSSMAILSYEGFDASVIVSKCTDTFSYSELEGEKGTILIDQPGLINKAWLVDRKTKEERKITDEETNMFSFQLKDLVRNLQDGKEQSQLLPHSLSLDILDTLEQCRKIAGVFYPGEE